MRTVDAGWPEYWASVEAETSTVGSSMAAYESEDHDHVVATFAAHWDLLEPLVDDPALDYVPNTKVL